MKYDAMKPGTNVWVTQAGGTAVRAVVIEYRGALGVGMGASKHIYRVRDGYGDSYEASADRIGLDMDPACAMCKTTGRPMRTLSDSALTLTICQDCVDYANEAAGPSQRA